MLDGGGEGCRIALGAGRRQRLGRFAFVVGLRRLRLLGLLELLQLVP